MKRNLIISWIMLVVGLLISLVYFLIFSYDRAMILGGGTLSLLLMPFVGFLSLIIKKFVKLFVLIFIFLLGHVVINHLIASPLATNVGMNSFVAVYIGIWSSAMELCPLLFLSYVLLKRIEKEKKEVSILKQNLLYSPGIILMFVIGYGILIGETLIKAKHQLPVLFSLLTIFVSCFAVVLFLASFFLFRLPGFVIENLIVTDKFRLIPRIDSYFSLSLVSFILLSAMAESARGYWLFWFLNTFAVVAAFVSQWKFIRILFLNHSTAQEEEPKSFYFPRIWSLRFLVWNLIIYFILVAGFS